MILSPRFEQALLYAAVVHAGQLRKATRVPYLAHLLAVTALVLEHGGDETEAIAALLHDAVEDAGGAGRRDFGFEPPISSFMCVASARSRFTTSGCLSATLVVSPMSLSRL